MEHVSWKVQKIKESFKKPAEHQTLVEIIIKRQSESFENVIEKTKVIEYDSHWKTR